MQIPKVYDPTEIERKWYPIWEGKGYYVAQAESDKPAFCIAIPPPNVTGYLHMGHALQHTLMDILTRWRRMQGYNALWLPGTDHAGISTQIVVERQLAEEGLTRYDLGREEFEKRVWQWKEHAGGTIQRQIRREGASCDWTRERFTLDEGLSQAVREVFVRLYEEGLIYRGSYIVNWCPKDQTALSDLEAPKEEVRGKLYYINYKVKDSNEFVTVATTRPETMLGDTAVAVNPSDERYRHLHGRVAILPIVGRELPFITDEIVEPDFGTGVVKVTPAHDPNDFRMGLRHSLAQVVVIDKQGKMTEAAGAEFAGLDRFEARKKLVAMLKDQGLLVKVEDYIHKVGHCQRCHTVIEPLVSTQWFCRMREMADAAIAAVKDGRTQFIPESWAKVYFDWLENIQDWCISRQLWWGHRIPAWYCQDCLKVTVARTDPQNCSSCGSEKILQDEDVLDTWFSSALWPFSTLGWPEQTADLKTFYPTSVMITGFDIIFFWIARMMMMGLKFMGDVPFRKVFITGLVRVEGEKMSKMKGNVVDPLDVFERYGTDAVRFTLASAVGSSADVDLQMIKRKGADGEEIREYPKMEAARNFANKIWNAARFVLLNIEGTKHNPAAFEGELGLYDRWILSKLNHTIERFNDALENFRFFDATQTLYHFFWDDFCDWYIELSKPLVTAKDPSAESVRARERMLYVLERSLRMLHPVMPYITEELWHMLPHEGETISLAPFPTADLSAIDESVEADMNSVISLITKIRNVRAEMNIPNAESVKVKLAIKDEHLSKIVASATEAIKRLARCSEVEILDQLPEMRSCARAVITGIDIAIPLEGLIDLDKERERLKKELLKIETEAEKLQARLANPNFVERAQPEVVEQSRLRLADLHVQRQTITKTLESL
ncbi:MAG: valine--tRNA ligase [Acidobacteriota bacterium]|nr:valine--tRNA ligase [Blastocatellia bacterium]MDW8412831.1 valine--tRNA ligase [Acidobacteriota bacterium]